MSKLNKGKHSPNSDSGGSGKSGAFRMAAIAGAALLASAGVIAFSATSASAGTPQHQTKTVSWVMADQNGSATNITYPQYIVGSDKAPTCGHEVQTDVYYYDTSAHRKTVDNLIAGGVLDNRSGHGPSDYSVIKSWSFSRQDACAPPAQPSGTVSVALVCGSQHANGEYYQVKIDGKWVNLEGTTNYLVGVNSADGDTDATTPDISTDAQGTLVVNGTYDEFLQNGFKPGQYQVFVLKKGADSPVWTQQVTLTAPDCTPPVQKVQPSGVTFKDSCTGGTATIPATTDANPFTYQNGTTVLAAGDVAFANGTSVDIKAVPSKTGVQATGTDEWTHSFAAPNDCTTTSPAPSPSTTATTTSGGGHMQGGTVPTTTQSSGIGTGVSTTRASANTTAVGPGSFNTGDGPTTQALSPGLIALLGGLFAAGAALLVIHRRRIWAFFGSPKH